MQKKWYERKLEQHGAYSNYLPRTVRYKFLDYKDKQEKQATAKYKSRKAKQSAG